MTILNEGPSTVYLDGVSSVSVGSFALAPNSTMTWKASEPLWALTRTGSARLNVNIYGGLSITNTRQFDPLYTEQFAKGDIFQTKEYVETSTYDSLYISVAMPDAPITVIGTAINVEVFWYTEDGTALAPEFSRFWIASTPLYMTTPVKGTFALIIVTTSVDVTPLIRIQGSTRALAHAMQYYPPTYSESPSSAENVSWGRGIVNIRGWQKRNVYLPAWGTIIDVTLRYSRTTTDTHTVTFVDNYDATLAYGEIDIDAGTDVFSQTLYVPRSRGIVLQENTDETWSGSVNITCVWRDYQ